MVKRDFIISIISLSLGLFILFKKDNKSYPSKGITVVEVDSLKRVESRILYGFVTDNMNVVEEKIKPNQNLSEILSLYNVSLDVIDRLAQESIKIFDLRKIIPHKKYTLFCSKDSLKKAQYFIYEPNEYEYVVFNLSDSINISRHFRDIDTVTSTISGVIENSLFESMVDNGAQPEFAYDLAEVFKWQVDFYKVQKGDRFKVIFEEVRVEGKPVATGKILGALFNHNGEDFYAINFDQGRGSEYFDNNGKNLQKAFLKAPLKFSRISSRYSLKRFHPVNKIYKAHLGTDYAAPAGTPINTVGDGLILEAKYTSANGNYVKIKHDGTYTTQYLHMSKIAPGIRAGRKIRQGEIIGYVGSTGLATGPHLCFRFWMNGKQVDALKVKIPPTEPVKEEYQDEFDRVRQEITKKLDAINFDKPKYLASSEL